MSIIPLLIKVRQGALLNQVFAITTDSEDGVVDYIVTDSEDGILELILIDQEDR